MNNHQGTVIDTSALFTDLDRSKEKVLLIQRKLVSGEPGGLKGARRVR
jgi:hypothetical protein